MNFNGASSFDKSFLIDSGYYILNRKKMFLFKMYRFCYVMAKVVFSVEYSKGFLIFFRGLKMSFVKFELNKIDLLEI